MDAKHRLSDQEQNASRVNLDGAEGRREGRDTMQASPRSDVDEEEGQLGPDELPDPAEVVMNHEAKLHR